MQGRIFQNLLYRVPFLNPIILLIKTREALPFQLLTVQGLLVLCTAAVLGEEQKSCGDSLPAELRTEGLHAKNKVWVSNSRMSQGAMPGACGKSVRWRGDPECVGGASEVADPNLWGY